MKNILNNKFFIIISLFIILTFLIFTNCFANNVSVTYNDNIYTIDIPVFEEYPYYITQNTGSIYYIYYLTSKQKESCFYGTDRYGWENSIVFEPTGYKVYHFSLDEGCTNFNLTSVNQLYSSHPNNCLVNCPIENYSISNFDIKDKKGNLVFQGAPQRVEQVTIPEIQSAMEIPQVMNKVLEMIIPIGLIIFGIGLIIYLVQLVISRMK